MMVLGTYIRALWTWPQLGFGHVPFLIHAHSHLGLLGWMFPAIAGLATRHLAPECEQKALMSRWYWYPMHAFIITMTIAFALEGYAFWSILLSTLFLAISSAWVVHLFSVLISDSSLSVRVFKLGILFYLISNIGPLALSMASKMGPEWIPHWVSYYIHFQINAWIPVALLGIMLSSSLFGASNSVKYGRFGWILALIFMIGTLLQYESMTRIHALMELSGWIGFAGSVLTLISGGILTSWLLKTQKGVFVIVGLALFLLKLGVMVHASFPGIGEKFMVNPMLKVGFAHLSLLGSSTLILLYLIQKFSGESTSPRLTQSKPPVSSYISSGLILTGILSMIFILFYLGMSPWITLPHISSPQFLLFLSGIIIVIGLIGKQANRLIGKQANRQAG
jgi:hypothetical protein